MEYDLSKKTLRGRRNRQKMAQTLWENRIIKRAAKNAGLQRKN